MSSVEIKEELLKLIGDDLYSMIDGYMYRCELDDPDVVEDQNDGILSMFIFTASENIKNNDKFKKEFIKEYLEPELKDIQFLNLSYNVLVNDLIAYGMISSEEAKRQDLYGYYVQIFFNF